MLPFFFILSSFCSWFCIISVTCLQVVDSFFCFLRPVCWALLVTFHLSYCTLQLQNFCLVYLCVSLFIDIWWGIVFILMFNALDMVSFRSLSILKWRMLSFWLGSLYTWLPQGVERLALIYKTYWHYYDVSVPVVILLLFLLLNFMRMRVSL